jgi:hypothetical protein
MQHTRPSFRAFTLIEMMIALVITMMMVFAMVEAFQYIGEATTAGRAQIEMAGQLRAARYRLELDLNGVTVPMRPWGDNQAELGYFELIEGPASDYNPGQFVSPTASGYTAINFNDPQDNLAQASRSMFGDLDDILAFTVRNDKEPFRGRYVTLDANNQPQTIVIESNLAEVIWWAELNDTKPETPDGQWSPGETFTIRRRVLLIRPDLIDASTGGTTLNMYSAKQNNPAFPGPALASYPQILPTDANAVARFLDENDVSIRPVYDANYALIGYAPNTLSDLTLRQNRTSHWAIDYSLRDSGSTPQRLGLSNVDGTAAGMMLAPFRINPDVFPGFRRTSDRFGEDVMLTNVTAFDFRVWDPRVRIVTDAGGFNEALVPGDPGYNEQFNNAIGNANLFVGQGAYVDLGGMAHEPIPAVNPTNSATLASAAFTHTFLGSMNAKARLGNANFVYDPWSIAYEKDGFNQDGDNDSSGNSLVDEGTDGLDLTDATTGNRYASGPDDSQERETSPPYPYPLKSIRVSIRMYEADTRQVRQSTHEMNFSP